MALSLIKDTNRMLETPSYGLGLGLNAMGKQEDQLSATKHILGCECLCLAQIHILNINHPKYWV